MAHERRHRGTHPEDASLFSDQQIPKLREALSEYCWLLSRHYATASSLKLVGDKFQLSERQRMLLMRSACSDSERTNRQTNQVDDHDLQGQQVFIDGFN